MLVAALGNARMAERIEADALAYRWPPFYFKPRCEGFSPDGDLSKKRQGLRLFRDLQRRSRQRLPPGCELAVAMRGSATESGCTRCRLGGLLALKAVCYYRVVKE